jgi:hypothetical protein
VKPAKIGVTDRSVKQIRARGSKEACPPLAGRNCKQILQEGQPASTCGLVLRSFSKSEPARSSFSVVGHGIILARFFDSFFIDWKNGYTAIRFTDGSFLITPLALFRYLADQSFNGEDKSKCSETILIKE